MYTDLATGSADSIRTRTRVTRVPEADKVVTAHAHSIRFDKGAFETEKAVRTYLKEHGYGEGHKVLDTKTEYVVKSDRPESDYSDLREIDLQNGIVMKVGTLSETEEEEEETEKTGEEDGPPAVFAELVKKYDEFIAHFSDGKTLVEVMKDGADGLPPGIFEVNNAFYTALRNNLSKGEFSAVKKLTSEFGDMIIKMAETFREAVVEGGAEDAQKAAFLEHIFKGSSLGKPKDEGKKPKREKYKKSKDEEEEEEKSGTLTVKMEGLVASLDKDGEQTSDGEQATNGEADSGEETVVQKALQAVLDQFSDKLDKATSEIDEQVTELASKVASVSERVSALSDEQQARKSADEEDNVGGTRKSAKGADKVSPEQDRLFRNTLGFQSVSPPPAGG